MGKINPAQLMEMLMDLIGQIVHRKAPKATKYVAPQLSPQAIKRKLFKEMTPEIKEDATEKNEVQEPVNDKSEDKNIEIKVDQLEEPKIEESKNENVEVSDSQNLDENKEEKEQKQENESSQEKSLEPIPSTPSIAKSTEKKKRRKSLTRSRIMSRYALKTKDSGDFCVVAQGNETVHKWKDVLCHREFEFLLPELTADDEEGAFLYLVVSEDSDTEYESEPDDDAQQKLAKSEAMRLERRKREKIEILAAKKRAEKRMKKKSTEPLFAKKKSSKSKYDFFCLQTKN